MFYAVSGEEEIARFPMKTLMSNSLRVGYRQSFALLFEDPEHFQGPGGSRQRILLKSLMLKQQSQPPSRKGKSYKENAIQYECSSALISPLFRLNGLHDYISCKRNNTER